MAAHRHNVNVLLRNSTFLIFADLFVRCRPCRRYRLHVFFHIYRLFAVKLRLPIYFEVDISFLTRAFELKTGETSSTRVPLQMVW